MAAYMFAKDPVWSQTTCSGFRQQAETVNHLLRINCFKNEKCFVKNGDLMLIVT